jgi:hypothetical protein
VLPHVHNTARLVLAIVFVSAGSGATAPADPAPAEVGAGATVVSGPRVAAPGVLDLDGHPADPLADARAKAIVLLFVRTDCPISNRYAPELRRLREEFASRGVAFWLVYPDPGETPEAIRKHHEDYRYEMGALRDTRHELVKKTGVRVTPEAAVFVRAKVGGKIEPAMVYHGRIDDRYADLGKMRPEPTTHDLEKAIDAVLSGKRVARRVRPAIGCDIPDLP